MKIIQFIALCLIAAACSLNQPKPLIICNPLNLSYRYMPDTPSRREAADPTMVVYKNEYYLFASKSGGYWWSANLAHWHLVETNEIPVEDYAPAAIVINDTFYFIASSGHKNPILRSTNPKTGHWEVVRQSLPFAVWDPSFFLDDNNKLYLYWGCSDKNPLYGIELDYTNNFEPIGEPIPIIFPNTLTFGWENPGNNNELTSQLPWIEGPWMDKVNGTYYLQYAAPGTEFKTYCDAVYVGDKPLGPFKIQDLNPFSFKPAGFIPGAGHGSSFCDKYGNWWHIATFAISVNHMFERRLGLFPVFFDKNGSMYAYTAWGDYPFVVPQKKITRPEEILTNWNLLSFNKKVTTSSVFEQQYAQNAIDENVRTWWCAASANKGEWLTINLGEQYNINAVQINYADHNSGILGRQPACYYQYLLEYSSDSILWNTFANKSENKTDSPHDLVVLPNSVKARYIRFTNIYVPSGYVALSGLRVFGTGNGLPPEKTNNITAERNKTDRRMLSIQWKGAPNATGYNIAGGPNNDQLYLNTIVYGTNVIEIRSLNANLPWFFTITAFNENGKGPVSEVVSVK